VGGGITSQLTDPELAVFGEAAQPMEVRCGRDVSQVRVVMTTQLGGGGPRQSLLVQTITDAVVRRPTWMHNHDNNWRTRNHKVIWEKPRRHPSRLTKSLLVTLQWDAPRLVPKLPFPINDHNPI